MTLTFVCQRTEQQQIQWWCCVTSTGTHREDGGLDTVWQLISEQLTSSDSSGALSPLCLPATRPSQSRSTHKLLLLQPLDPQDTAQPPSTHTVLFTLSSTKITSICWEKKTSVLQRLASSAVSQWCSTSSRKSSRDFSPVQRWSSFLSASCSRVGMNTLRAQCVSSACQSAEDTHCLTVSEDTHCLTVSEDTHWLTVSEDTHCLTDSEDTHCLTVSEDTHCLTVSEDTHWLTVSEDTHWLWGHTLTLRTHTDSLSLRTHTVSEDTHCGGNLWHHYSVQTQGPISRKLTESIWCFGDRMSLERLRCSGWVSGWDQLNQPDVDLNFPDPSL